jgi:NADPH2:quinone reductase
MKYQDLSDLSPSDDQALVQIEAVGVNYTDTYSRSGVNPTALPWVVGVEGAGVVKQVGKNVTQVSEGDSVVYCGIPGSYAEQAIVPADRLIKIPQGLDSKASAAAMLQGMTAHYLCHSTYQVKQGDKVLVHAGAGGVGLLLIQMVKRLGGYVFSTVSTEAKAQLAIDAGADEVILYTSQDFAEEVNKSTNGQGVEVVYDAVGQTTFDGSINSLARRRYMVLYGQASGPVPPVDPRVLGNGSKFLTRPGLGDYTVTRQELEQRAGDVLGWVKSGELKLRIEHVMALSEASEAHRQLESRLTTGKVVLIP